MSGAVFTYDGHFIRWRGMILDRTGPKENGLSAEGVLRRMSADPSSEIQALVRQLSQAIAQYDEDRLESAA